MFFKDYFVGGCEDRNFNQIVFSHILRVQFVENKNIHFNLASK